MSRRFIVALLSLALLGACASTASAARFYTPDYGGSPPEKIGGFDLGADGSIAPIPGSPFPGTSPAATGGLTNLAFSPDGSRAASAFLFSGGAQSYRVPAGGVFELATTVPFASATSVAVTPDGRFAYFPTREFGSPAEGIRGFALNADGSLTSLGPGTPVGGESYDVAITPDGRFLFAQNGNEIDRFAIGGDGSLTPLGSTPAPEVFRLKMAASGRFLFAQLGSGIGTFAVAADGGLTKVGPTAMTGGFSTRQFDVAPDGSHVYVPNYNEDLIITVAIAADGTPSVVGPGTPIVSPEAIGVSPDGRFLVYYRGGGSDNSLGIASFAADGTPVLLNRETPWSTGEPERIVFQPQPVPVARFTARAAAPGEAASFSAGASTGASRYEWDFGDGARLADGGSAPSHVYARPGTYAVTLKVFDRNGCSTQQVYDGQSTACPGGSAAVATATVDTLPALGRVKAQPKKFLAKPKGKAKGKYGTTFTYSVSEPATVAFKFERKTVGRLVGGKCKPRTSRNASRKKCPIFKKVSSRSQAAKAGANKLKWNGRVKGKPLAAGSYRATVVATDKAGGRSAPKTVGFRILSPQEP